MCFPFCCVCRDLKKYMYFHDGMTIKMTSGFSESCRKQFVLHHFRHSPWKQWVPLNRTAFTSCVWHWQILKSPNKIPMKSACCDFDITLSAPLNWSTKLKANLTRLFTSISCNTAGFQHLPPMWRLFFAIKYLLHIFQVRDESILGENPWLRRSHAPHIARS